MDLIQRDARGHLAAQVFRWTGDAGPFGFRSKRKTDLIARNDCRNQARAVNLERNDDIEGKDFVRIEAGHAGSGALCRGRCFRPGA